METLEDSLSSKSSIVLGTKDSSIVQDERSLLTPGKVTGCTSVKVQNLLLFLTNSDVPSFHSTYFFIPVMLELGMPFPGVLTHPIVRDREHGHIGPHPLLL